MYQRFLASVRRTQQSLLKLLSNQGKSFLVRATAGTFGLKVVNAVLLYVNSLLLARILGASGFGIYSYAGAWLNLLLIPATLGIEGLILRENSVYYNQANWSYSKGVLEWGNKLVLISSITTAIIACLIFWRIDLNLTITTQKALTICIISLPFLALSRIRQSIMQSIGHVVIGQIPEILLNPLTISFFLVAISISAIPVNPIKIIVLKVICHLVSFAVGTFFLYKFLPFNVKKATPNHFGILWFKSTVPMFFISSMYIINNQTDAVMLGILSDTKYVGIYNIANKGSGLIGFILMACNTALGPTFANLYNCNNKIKLQSLVTKSSRIAFFSSLLIASLIIIFGQKLLLLFGSEFVQGYGVLTILSIAQLINSFAGSVALLLVMTNNEKYTAKSIALTAVLNILLNAALIPMYNATGAAIATATSTLVWNSIMAYFCYKKIAINTTPIKVNIFY